MVAPFSFSTAQRIIFGQGESAQLPSLAAAYGENLFVVTGANQNRFRPLLASLETRSHSCVIHSCEREPSIQDLEDAVVLARACKTQCIIGLGGGAVLDLAKAIAIMCTNPGQPLDYLEVIGHGQSFQHAALPYIALPTTAGTGAEVTKNAVLYSPEHAVKISMRHDSMIPRIALIDPELTMGMPAALTATTGMDALTQLIEPFLSPMATPITDALCRQAIPLAANALPVAYQTPEDRNAREAMALASLYGGVALANAKLGSVHGIAGPLGGMCPEAPHGLICARLLHDCLHINYQARERGDQATLEKRYGELASLLTGGESDTPEDGLEVIQYLQKDLEIPRLASCGLTKEHFPELIKKSRQSSSMKGNPIELTEAELEQILTNAL